MVILIDVSLVTSFTAFNL